MDLTTDLAGIKLRNPTMLAAGILGISSSLLNRIYEAGAGCVITKSIGPVPRPGYSNPCIVEVPGGYLNAMGLPNPGIEIFLEELNELNQMKIPTVVSIFADNETKFANIARIVEEKGALGIELNISCPHAEVASIGQNPIITKRVVEAVKHAVSIPIFVKLTPNVTDIVEIAVAAEKAGADGLTAINTVRSMALDIYSKTPILSNKYGGLSGPAIKPIAIRCIYDIYESVKIPLIGVGGILSWQDAIEFFLAGASAVQIGTGIRYRGLSIFQEICKGIQEYLKNEKYSSLSEIIGVAHRA
ncbi:MAG TPA: dihydroorotate dehydrogenase [Candidatus Deferrimicrobium sp.]|nr:dihydroorotate dehydrogenase [Candidatus Deferrimicrobium sp.]